MDVKEMASLGGKARKEALTPEQRKTIAAHAAQERWAMTDPKRYFHENRKKPTRIGRMSEILFEKKTASIGLPRVFLNGRYDYWVNGHNVEVKCSTIHKTGRWGFSIQFNRDYDFVAFLLIERMEWFIFPKRLLKCAVCINSDENSQSWKKHEKYRENWKPLLKAGKRKNPKE